MPHSEQIFGDTPEKTKGETRERTGDSRHHPPTPEEEESLDRTLEESFPASDPPSSIPDPDADAA